MIDAFVIAALVALLLVPAGRPGRHRDESVARELARHRVPAAGCAAVGVGVIVAPVPALAVVALGGGAMIWRRRIAEARREADRSDSVPEVADLLGVVVGAGGTVADALSLVAERGPAPTRAAFAAVIADADHGLGLVASLQRADLPPAFRSLLSGLVSAERDGAPLGVVVARLADVGRAARDARIRARIQRLPVLLLAPLTLCCLPAVLIGAVVPVALAHLSTLGF